MLEHARTPQEIGNTCSGMFEHKCIQHIPEFLIFENADSPSIRHFKTKESVAGFAKFKSFEHCESVEEIDEIFESFEKFESLESVEDFLNTYLPTHSAPMCPHSPICLFNQVRICAS